MRVEREQDEFIVGLAIQRGDGFGSVGVPVAHGDEGASGNMGLESRFERAGLLFGEAANGRSATDFHVMLADDFRAGSGDQFSNGFARQEGAGEIDDVWIAEQIIEKWLDGGLAVWAA